MSTRHLFASFLVLLFAYSALAQAPPDLLEGNNGGAQFQTPPQFKSQPTPIGVDAPATNVPPPTLSPNEDLGQQFAPANAAPASGLPQLSREYGQVWQTYDISPYTSSVTSKEKPEQAIIDWILRETGTDVWFSESVALLSANRTTLQVYHRPDIQAVVKATVDRFVSSRAESYVMGMRLVTVGSPNWRSKAFTMLRPVSVQTPGVEAWLVSKENAAVLLGELKKRTDFQEHNSPNLIMHNGQSHAIARRRPQSFVRSVVMRGDSGGGFDLDMGQFDEGFSLNVSPLYSSDGQSVDAVLKCDVDQIEKFVPIPIDVPLATGGIQRVQIQIPQVVSWRLYERFRWPVDEVLLLSCGVVAMPGPERGSPLGIPIRLNKNEPGRADALLFIESKGKSSELLIDGQRTADSATEKYRGRY